MKNTLSAVFDEARADELERLVRQNPAPEVPTDALAAIKKKVYARTGITKTKRLRAFRRPFWAAAAACLLLAAGIFFNKGFHDSGPSAIVPQPLPTDMDNILWAGNGLDDSDHADAFVAWNGWSMDSSLYETLNRANPTDFIAIVVRKTNAADRDAFAYRGTTFAQLQAQRNDLYRLSDNLLTFRKEGEWLKYGEQLYTTGTPDGEKWSKAFYDERVACYGADFIARYIIDGAVQTTRLQEDYLTCQQQISENAKNMAELLQAYHESTSGEVESHFARAGFHTAVRGGTVFLFAQKDALASLNMAHKQDYLLSLAVRAAFEGTDENHPVTDEVVTDACTPSDAYGFSR